jgi:hypothetical protein
VRAREGQAAGAYGAGFTVGPMARKESRSGLRRTGDKVTSDKQLTEFGRMAEGDCRSVHGSMGFNQESFTLV